MDERALRLAENETVFRAGNEVLDANRRGSGDGDTSEGAYLCECGSATCFERVSLTRAEYEAVRAHPAHFFVVPGHENAAAGEVVVGTAPHYVVVEKTADGRTIAQQTDPRPEP